MALSICRSTECTVVDSAQMQESGTRPASLLTNSHLNNRNGVRRSASPRKSAWQNMARLAKSVGARFIPATGRGI
jgi:hypothetical protein